jgi:hypothetical protein
MELLEQDWLIGAITSNKDMGMTACTAHGYVATKAPMADMAKSRFVDQVSPRDQ